MGKALPLMPWYAGGAAADTIKGADRLVRPRWDI